MSFWSNTLFGFPNWSEDAHSSPCFSISLVTFIFHEAFVSRLCRLGHNPPVFTPNVILDFLRTLSGSYLSLSLLPSPSEKRFVCWTFARTLWTPELSSSRLFPVSCDTPLQTRYFSLSFFCSCPVPTSIPPLVPVYYLLTQTQCSSSHLK